MFLKNAASKFLLSHFGLVFPILPKGCELKRRFPLIAAAVNVRCTTHIDKNLKYHFEIILEF